MPTAARLIVAPVLLFVLAMALDAQPPKDPPRTGVKLPDGTYLWTGDTLPDTVALSPQELQKLLDQVELLKKQLAARKAMAPSRCAIRGKIEKRGEAVVAALKLAYSFRTTSPRTAVALGGRRGFLVNATLEGGRLPVLDMGDEGFVALIETAGEHTLQLELESPVVGRGTKTEVGFDLGLPRAAITTLALDVPTEMKQVALVTRTPDPTKPTPDVRRIPSLDSKRLAPKSPTEPAFALGPVDQIELSWEPPATATQPADSVRSAEWEIATVFTEGLIETTARLKLKGAPREWKFVAPANADVTTERAVGASTESGPTLQPTISKPTDNAKPVWKVDLPGAATDWVIVAVVRQSRPKAADAKHRGPFAIGPFNAVDVFRQTGTVRASTVANSRFVAKHGPELRQAEASTPPDDDRTVVQFRWNGGPTSVTPSFSPLLTLEVQPLQSALRVKPAYRLKWTEAGWRVRAEVRVIPIRREVEAVTIEVPTEWGTPEASPAELVDGVQPLKDGPRRTIAVKLTAGHKQPFDMILDATVPMPAGAREGNVPLLRFPGADERDATLLVTVPDGLDLRGTGREWAGDQPLGWGQPLLAVPGADGKMPRPVNSISGKFEGGVARAELGWPTYRPELSADTRADITIHDRQIVVVQQFKLKAPDGFSRPVRFRVPAGATGLKSVPPLDPVGPSEWSLPTTPDTRDATAIITFALPLPPPSADVRRTPVGLVWVPAATRTETRTRVWSNAMQGRTITLEPGAWREVSAEPSPERESLPALSLVGTGTELPLVLELRDEADAAAVAVWVERAAIQASATEDGGTAIRARFQLRRWLAGGIELRLPTTTAGTQPVFQLDGKRVEAAPAGEERAYRVPLPEGRVGRTAILEVRYQLPANRLGGGSLYTPPVLLATAYAGPVRWLVSLPPGEVALTTDAAPVETRWRWRAGLFRPSATWTAEELDRWFRTGTDPTAADGGDAVVMSLASVDAVRVRRISRVGLVVGCSLGAMVLGWLVVRVRGSAGGVLVSLVAGAVAAGVVLEPLATQQVVSAAQPGVLVLLAVLVALAIARWYHRNRVTHLPGFTRRPAEVEPPANNRPRGADTTGSLQAAGSGVEHTT